MKYQCPACKRTNEVTITDKKSNEFFSCDFCFEEFFYIDGVFFILTNDEDFYNWKKKLKRFVGYKNAKG